CQQIEGAQKHGKANVSLFAWDIIHANAIVSAHSNRTNATSTGTLLLDVSSVVSHLLK
ncbi:hypothetical protein MTO96_045416, partial [Rhipicephalus appendiculatus]